MSAADFSLPPPVDKLSFLPAQKSIVLSASVPAWRNPLDFEPADQQAVEEINQNYVSNARPERIRAAVVALTRVALARQVRLVFGAHPTISPMILQVAQDMDARDDSILVFQSNAYRSIIPGSTLQFANWSRGRLILTREKPEPHLVPTPLKRLSPYPNSLKHMRTMMMEVPGVIGAVFIGGMNGVEDEADLFAQVHLHLRLRRYAFASTGSAALRLEQRFPGAFHGTLPDPQAFRTTLSYTIAASMVLDELVPPAAGSP